MMQKVMSRGAAISAAVFLLLALSGCFSTPLVKGTRTASMAMPEGRALQVETRNGYIEVIRGDTAEVAVEAQVRVRSQERLDTVDVMPVDDGQRVSLRPLWPDGSSLQRNEGVSFKLVVPGVEGVTLETGNGHLKLQGLSGPAALETSNGRIEVREHAGEVSARTSNGSVVVHEVQGQVDVHTSNGDVEVRGAAGAVQVRTSNGSIEIALAEASRGPLTAISSNGSVSVVLSPSFSGILTLKTSNGGIKLRDLPAARIIDSGKHEMKLQLGESTEESRVVTSNGNVTVRLAAE
ncbi:MAG: DUF4097 family beta strand repeat-containing protein [Verrucomicrobiota bacterium JB022]|nr:DUF4097 family beta strand repeat-containing protein [Verrucomicrobiota bacterium JB022]